MSEKLLRCPFCGSRGQVFDQNDIEPMVECLGCEVVAQRSMWQTRAIPQEVKDVMTALKAYIDYWDSGLPCVITEEKANLWKAFKSFEEANDV